MDFHYRSHIGCGHVLLSVFSGRISWFKKRFVPDFGMNPFT